MKKSQVAHDFLGMFGNEFGGACGDGKWVNIGVKGIDDKRGQHAYRCNCRRRGGGEA